MKSRYGLDYLAEVQVKGMDDIIVHCREDGQTQGQPTALNPHQAGIQPHDGSPAKALPHVKAVQKLGLPSNLNSPLWEEASH